MWDVIGDSTASPGGDVSSLATRFARLPDFPFRRLSALLSDIAPPAGMPVIDLGIGEPQHAPPAILARTIAAHGDSWNRYPPPVGTAEFREACAHWLVKRFGLGKGAVDPSRHVLPLAGTKEGLFLLPATLPVKGGGRPLVAMPDPLYSVYLGGAVLAGAEPVLLPANREAGFLPNLDELDEATLQRLTALFICNPANPQGSCATRDYIDRALALARRHGFLLILDECYSEIYDCEPPLGGLTVAHELTGTFENLVVVHSLSKRSNAAGLRSGFVAGDAEVLEHFARLRAYGAAVQPLPIMAAATALWQDEVHVVTNRQAYRRKLDIADRLLGERFGFYRPSGGFFLWLDVGDGVAVARRLWAEAGLRTLPGQFLSAMPPTKGNHACGYLRMALVHEEAVIEEAIGRLVRVLDP